MTATTGTAQLSAGVWAIDPIHSSVGFSVRRLMVAKVRGVFETFSGAITVAEDGTPSVSAEIAIDSVNTYNEQLNGVVKSPQFFDAEQYPTATYRSTAVRADGDDYLIDGEFTLKGITKPVSLTLEFNGVHPGMGHGEVAGFEATAVLNRSDFGIDFNIPIDVGIALAEDVTITLSIEALKQA